MKFEKPTERELTDVSNRLDITIPENDRDRYREVIFENIQTLERIHEHSDRDIGPNVDTHTFERAPYRPPDDENPYNAWITKCRIDGADDGALTDKRVGLKDSIALAGVEMTCGSQLLEGYVPERSATVVKRLLQAGATISGKCNMENFSFSSLSESSDFGVVTNPRDPNRIAGGSSSGSAAAVAAGEVDIALGCDQGASIRVPAACCGVVGLDPTMGLVPYTGIFPMDPTIDHVGPISRTVEDAARTLEVIAGADGYDQRQPDTVDSDQYTDSLGASADKLRVGVLKEGFRVADADDRVTDVVHRSIETGTNLGVDTTTVSLPMHHDGVVLGYMVWGYGALQTFKQGGQEILTDGWYDTDLMETLEKFRRSREADLSPEGKITLLTMEYLEEQYGGVTYGKAQNLRKRMRKRVDALLENVDVLALPTMPTLPLEISEGANDINRVLETITLCRNTATFSLTNHPSISIPCGTVDGVPIGLMLVADHFDERTLFRAASVFEQEIDPITA